jgi:hypothetical protein
MIDRYRWRGGEELIQRWGAQHVVQVLMFEPLFEEKNRLRRLIAQLATRLEGAGVGLALADLPGTGESLIEIEGVSFADWRAAAAAAVGTLRPAVIASMRGGALLDGQGAANGHWRFAPETGARLIRDLRRTQVAGGDPGSFAGHRLSNAFVDACEAAVPAELTRVRTVRLESDPGPADARYDAPPLWRRAEPGEDGALADALAEDLSTWAKTCATS